jgi:hypothetical protein
MHLRHWRRSAIAWRLQNDCSTGGAAAADHLFTPQEYFATAGRSYLRVKVLYNDKVCGRLAPRRAGEILGGCTFLVLRRVAL